MATIYRIGDESGTVFASEELSRYLKKLTSKSYPVKSVRKFDVNKPGIWVGVSLAIANQHQVPIEKSLWDDGYTIKSFGHQLIISATNGRSVLFAIYDYLHRLGVMWVRPGSTGEIVPHFDVLPQVDIDCVEMASYRHRGVCIEGSPSLDHALDMIDWMAKHRMNCFFLQFRNAGTFWDRWYSKHPEAISNSPLLTTDEAFVAKDKQIIAALERRGMVLHQVGHGWTAATLGLPANGWQTTECEVDDDKKRWVALVGGKRQLFHKVPINTELCYSHQPAFSALLDNILVYSRAHPEIDVLHIWLSDAMNNKCECSQCRKKSPSDWYVRLINALSEQLHLESPTKRFVFLSYFESWWPPEKSVINTSRDNAILMFAPISRCFSHALTDKVCTATESDERPLLNLATMPRSNQKLVALLAQWKKAFTGDSFLFDYYLWSGIHKQLSDVSLARIIHEDMRSLRNLELNGIVSCQVLRCSWPTGLPMTAMAETTWDRRLKWRDIKNEYLRSAYGSECEWVEKYLMKTEKLLSGKSIHDSQRDIRNLTPSEVGKLEKHLTSYHGKINNGIECTTEKAQKMSYSILLHHNQFLLMLCHINQGKRTQNEVIKWLIDGESSIHPYLDIPALMNMQFGLTDFPES